MMLPFLFSSSFGPCLARDHLMRAARSAASSQLRGRRTSRYRTLALEYNSWKLERQMARSVLFQGWRLYHDGMVYYFIALQLCRVLWFLSSIVGESSRW